ncbi:MAG: hypothetical protein ABSD47_02205 [Candidatus Methylomirabilota bacterium]
MRGLSTRVSDEIYSALCDQAKADGLTLSRFCAQILEDSIGPSSPAEHEPTGPSDPELLARLENVERFTELIFNILSGEKDWTIGETVECPRCRSTELMYLESGDQPPKCGFACASCDFNVEFTEAAAGRPVTNLTGEGEPS